MRIAIVDDLETERNLISQVLSIWSQNSKYPVLIDFFEDGIEFLNSAPAQKYNLIILDIYMKTITGIDTAIRFRESDHTTPIVFMTTSNEFHAEAFSVHAFDYIEKPVSQAAVNKLMSDLIYTTQPLEPYINITVAKQELSIFYDEIQYATVDSHYLEIQAKQLYRCRMSFSELSNHLELDSRFITINRGILVNLDYVKLMNKESCIMANDVQFPLVRRKATLLNQQYLNYQFSKRSNNLTRR